MRILLELEITTRGLGQLLAPRTCRPGGEAWRQVQLCRRASWAAAQELGARAGGLQGAEGLEEQLQPLVPIQMQIPLRIIPSAPSFTSSQSPRAWWCGKM